MSKALADKAKEVEQKVGELAALWKKSNSGANLDATGIKEFNDRNGELETMRSEFEALKSVHAANERNAEFAKTLATPTDGFTFPEGTQDSPQAGKKSFGELFTESAAFKTKGAKAKLTGVNVKTLMATTAGFAPEIVRNRPVLLQNMPPIGVLDTIPSRPVTQPGIKYMEEQPVAQVAEETNEGATYAEAAFNFVERDSPVRKITVWVPVTDEQLSDVDYIKEYLNMRLGQQLRIRLASQVVIGTGAAVNGNLTLVGMLNIVGILTDAKGTDPIFDAFLKAYTRIRTADGGYSDPSHTFMAPMDETNLRLIRNANDQYILGDPGSQPTNISVFGVPVVSAVQKPTGSAFVKDTSMLEIFTYDDVEVEISNSHADYFINGKQAVRAQMRCGFHDYRPASGDLITGI